MPSEAAHLALVQRNQVVLDELLQRSDECGEWIATVAFYKALHLVEAAFARDPSIQHAHDHATRNMLLRNNRRCSHIYKHYRPLWAASLVARYLEDPYGQDYSSFADYIAHDRVKPALIDHRLRQIEQSVRKLLSSP